MNFTWSKVLKVIISLAICLGVGFLGSYFTQQGLVPWYASLTKPSFSPPASVFAPVWTVLYILMGLAVAIIWIQGLNKEENRTAFTYFWVQLAINLLWSFAFFGLQSTLAGLIVIVILWLAIILTMIKFFPLSQLAGWLLVPYLLWVTFATVLNFSLWYLN